MRLCMIPNNFKSYCITSLYMKVLSIIFLISIFVFSTYASVGGQKDNKDSLYPLESENRWGSI